MAGHHSTEVEHRLTKLEWFVAHQRETNAKMDKRVTLAERGLLLLIVSLTALAHDRMPWLTKALIALMKAAPV